MKQRVQIILAVVLAMVLAAVSFVGGFYFHTFNMWDSCLDGGGAWDGEHQLCRKYPPHGGEHG